MHVIVWDLLFVCSSKHVIVLDSVIVQSIVKYAFQALRLRVVLSRQWRLAMKNPIKRQAVSIIVLATCLNGVHCFSMDVQGQRVAPESMLTHHLAC